MELDQEREKREERVGRRLTSLLLLASLASLLSSSLLADTSEEGGTPLLR